MKSLETGIAASPLPMAFPGIVSNGQSMEGFKVKNERDVGDARYTDVPSIMHPIDQTKHASSLAMAQFTT